MKTYYCLLFASLRKVTQEKVSLGLILFDGDTALCKFSRTKLNGLKHLLQKEDYKVISDSVMVLEKKMRNALDASLTYSNSLFKIEDPGFSLDYINYLSRYKNNLFAYSEPKKIDIEVTETNALKLFDTMVGAEAVQEPALKKTRLMDKLNLQYGEKIQNHFIAGHTITFQEVPALLVPVKVDLVGRNGVDVFVQSVDMTSRQNQIINEISTFYLLKDTYKKNKTGFVDFVLSEEPPKEFKDQHDIWRQLRDSKEFNYIDISESEKIIQYAETYKVRPVFGNIGETDTF